MRRRLFLICAGILLCAVAVPAQSRQFTVNGAERRFLLHLPDGIKRPPLLIVLHGYGSTPEDLFPAWLRSADENKFAVVALKSSDIGWTGVKDGVETFEALLSAVRQETIFDEQRIYIYGYSNGGRHAIRMGLLWSSRVAAVVSMAGFLEPVTQVGITAEQRVPFLFLSAEHDTVAPPAANQATSATLLGLGHHVEYREIRGVGHSYGEKADQVHRLAWKFLRRYRLSDKKRASLSAGP